MEEGTIHAGQDISSDFRMIIPENVQNKIRFLCNAIPDVEWSGVLFYKVSGTFEERDITVTCLDILQMDKGSKTYTYFKMNADVISYMLSHGLMEEGVYTGLVHSHNSMNVFFSDTDTDTLNDFGREMPHFVSLIVNNAGDRKAAITRHIRSTRLIEETLDYVTFGGEDKKEYRHNAVKSDYVEWYDLNIKTESYGFEEEMTERMNEIDKKNRTVQNRGEQLPLFNDNLSDDKKHKGYDCKPVITDDTVSDDVIDSVMWQTLTCNPFADCKRIDKEKILNALPSMYKKRFGNVDNFENFIYNFVDFLLGSDELLDLPPGYRDDHVSHLAGCVMRRIGKLPENEYFKAVINCYGTYSYD